MTNYTLDENNVPILCEDIIEWSQWFETADRVVENIKYGDVRISTVFLGIDHQFDDGPPLLFETLIFGGEHDDEMWRCSTHSEAVSQHKKACELVK